MMRAKVLAGAVLAAAVITPACGGPKDEPELSKDDYIAAADQICVTAEERVSTLGEPELTSPEGIAKYKEEYLPPLRDMLEQLRGLVPPADDADTLTAGYDRMNEYADKLDGAQNITDIATLGDPSGIGDLETYGFTKCFQSTGS